MPEETASENPPEQASPDELPPGGIPYYGEHGNTPDMRVSCGGVNTYPGRLGTDEIKWMLDDACKLLWQVAQISSQVLHSVRIEDIRKICAPDMPLVKGTIQADGTRAPEPAFAKASTGRPDSAEPAPEETQNETPARDHRKLPRGRVHPLLMLMRLGVQAARLLKQISGGTHPSAQNMLTVAQKLQLQAHKAELDWKRIQASGPYGI